MPELPEVETIRRGLEKYLVGQEMADIEVLSPKQFTGDPKLVIGAKITGVRRFGKGLVIDLSNNFSIAIHVKMTGQLIYVEHGANSGHCEKFPNKWTRVIFRIKKQELRIKGKMDMDSRLHPKGASFFEAARGNDNRREEYSYFYFNDIRKFGWVRVVRTKDVMDLPFFKSLGPEPLRDLDLPLFEKILDSSKAPIKSVLMDQHKISGIGNIYANEALFLARINPVRPASSLTEGESMRLLEAIEEVLQKGIDAGGSSMTNYVNVLGEKGTYQEEFLVYGREGERCSNCKGTVERIKTGGRGTFYCSKCQK